VTHPLYDPPEPPENEECPLCHSNAHTHLDDIDSLGDCDSAWESWYCGLCDHTWTIQTGPDPDAKRDQQRDDKLTGDR
jgi:hypothetical protein